LIDNTDSNVRATVGDTVAIKEDRLEEVTSSDPSIASLENGKIVCHKAGRTNITRTDGTYVSHYFVLVSDKTSLSLSKTEYALEKGKNTTIKSKVTNASASEMSYSSSNKTVATVNSNGKILAKQKGMATITVKLGSILEKVTVTVKDNSLPKTSGLKESYSVSSGKELKIAYTMKDAGDSKVVATGGKSKFKVCEGLYEEIEVALIIKVTDGYVTIKGMEKGKATITIRVGPVTKKITITVK